MSANDDIASLGQYWLRAYVVDGVSASGPNDPSKADGIAFVNQVAAAFSDITSFTGIVVLHQSLTDLNADTSHPDGTGGIVWNDPVATNNAFYVLAATSPGHWAKTPILLSSAISAAVTANTASIVTLSATVSGHTTSLSTQSGQISGLLAGSATQSGQISGLLAGSATQSGQIASANTRTSAAFGGGGITLNELAPIDVSVAGGGSETLLVAYDPRIDELVTADSPNRNAAPYNAKWDVAFTGPGGGVAGGLTPGGRWLRPSDAQTPKPYTKQVTDSGGSPRYQVHVNDGISTRRLTFADVDCYAPELIDDGLVKYVRDGDGRIGLASFGDHRNVAPSASGTLRILIFYGQSLGAGSINTGTAYLQAVTQHPPASFIKMFVGGIWPADPGDVTHVVNSGDGAIASIVPAYDSTLESKFGTTGDIECAWMLAGPPGRDGVDDYLIMNLAVGGQAYAALAQGTQPYNNILTCVTKAKALANVSPGYSACIVEAVYWDQGESNESDSVTTYRSHLTTLLANLNTDIAAITGQTNSISLFCPQKSCGNSGTAISAAQAVLAENIAGDGIYLTTPQYFCDYADTLHIKSEQYSAEVAHAGKVMRRVILDGEAWKPLYPISATRYGAQVEVVFNVPRGPLAIDTSVVTDPGSFGVQFQDSTNSAKVIGVRLKPGTQDTLIVDLSNAPTGSSPLLGFGFWYPGNPAIFTGTPPQPGYATGLRTCIRDSDPTACPRSGRPLYNYCAHSTVAVVSA